MSTFKFQCIVSENKEPKIFPFMSGSFVSERRAIVILALRHLLKTYPELFVSDEIISDDVHSEITGQVGGSVKPASSSASSPGIGDHPSSRKKGKPRVEAAPAKKSKEAPPAESVLPEQSAPSEAKLSACPADHSDPTAEIQIV